MNFTNSAAANRAMTNKIVSALSRRSLDGVCEDHIRAPQGV